RKIFDAYVDAGGNFLDTADAYTGGTSEQMIGEFVAENRDRFVIATKYTISRDRNDPNGGGNHRKSLASAIDASLKRLNTDYIDLYYAHMFDGFTPVEETVRALDDAVRAGKVLYVGLSDFPAWMVARADLYAEFCRFARPACIQIEYNLAMREGDRELVPMADALGLSVLDWSPLGGGALTGKLATASPAENYESRVASSAVARVFDKYKSAATGEIVAALKECAEALGTNPARLALGWLRARADIHIPIIGARSARHVEDNLKAADLVIPAEIFAKLDAVSAPPLGFPVEFLRGGQRDWFGEQPQRLDERARPVGRRFLGM
ncbi:MAG: aldo/keto reductase, partial [Pseudomonadota bacterium]